MNIIKKGISAVLSVCMVASLPFFVVGCSDNTPPEEHTHTYGEWKQSETEHWKESTCEHTGLEKDRAAHTFSGDTCSVCGYTKSAVVTPPEDEDDGDVMEFTKLTKNSDGYYVLEAEYTDVTAIEGTTYSGQAVGENVIVKDYDNKASNGHYVNYLYRYGNTLFFDIYSDSAASNVELVLCLAPYYQPNYSLEYEKFQVIVSAMEVNEDYTLTAKSNLVINYSTINLGEDYIQQNNHFNNGGFKDYTVSTKVRLSKGYNRISLVTNNNDKYAEKGDMSSTAPAIDCIKIKTDAALKMDVWDMYSTLK